MQVSVQAGTGDTLRQDSTWQAALAHGAITGHFRLYAMGTINRGALPDHHATAFGGDLGYRSAAWHRLVFSIAGGYTLPLFTSTDGPAWQRSRYEIGLFDVTGHRSNEYLYLHTFNIAYRSRDRRLHISLGKQRLDQPFLNAQDSRMHPTAFDGLLLTYTPDARTRFTVGWVHHVAPRGTLEWYTVARSIGAWPGQGRDSQERPAAYPGHVRTPGILTAQVDRRIASRIALRLHELCVIDVVNTAFVEVVYGPHPAWSFGLRAIRQDALGNGGAPVDSLAYLPRGASSHTFSARIEHRRGPWTFRINGTRITASGRFQLPREWGREPLYTYLARERNEGLGDVWATSVDALRHGDRLTLRMAAGSYVFPRDPRLNKYDMVPYAHGLIELTYPFRGRLRGVDLRVLYVHKEPLSRSVPPTVAQVYNRVDLHHFSLIMDYRF